MLLQRIPLGEGLSHARGTHRRNARLALLLRLLERRRTKVRDLAAKHVHWNVNTEGLKRVAGQAPRLDLATDAATDVCLKLARREAPDFFERGAKATS